MRTQVIVLALVTAAAAWAADAQVSPDQARGDYEAELARQCPEKQLQMLSPRDLSDGLDDYKQSLPTDVRDRLQQAETARCSSLDDGAACVNAADIAVADEVGRIGDLAGSICSGFLRCRDQGDCDYAR